MKREVISHKDPKSPISEVFRTLRTNIQFINNDRKIKTLLVTSTLPGEGKSWIASNLAVTFAQAGKKVVLIDADMRKGRQYVIFNTSPKPGLSNYLSQVGMEENKDKAKGIISCLQKTEVKNLYLMPAGSIPPNPSELLVSSKMIKLLEKLKKVSDIIIIDGTPCELVTDAIVLSRMVDSTVIVSAHKITKKDSLERVIKNIENVGGRIAGVVINKMPIAGRKYEERYYYYGKEANRQDSYEMIPVNQGKAKLPTDQPMKMENLRTTVERRKRDKKTEDILKQMNQYIDVEKYKKGENND